MYDSLACTFPFTIRAYMLDFLIEENIYIAKMCLVNCAEQQL